MREALFVLLFVVALLGLTAYRYRKQIFFGIQMWRSLNAARKNLRPPGQTANEDRPNRRDLVNCSKCGSWIPESTAIKLGKTAFYCSKECLTSGSADM